MGNTLDPKLDHANDAVCFSAMLREELVEIGELREKRRGGDERKDEADAKVTGTPDTNAENSADKVFEAAHQMSLVGLALSGGGIRSATFNLGVLQGLSELRLLPMFDYLSSVSGGGYIGAWLSAWIFRAASGPNGAIPGTPPPIASVQENLNPDRSAKPDHQEPRPIRFLREYSNYLTPRLGFLGADTWTAISIYTRNLFLNQTILILFLTSALIVPLMAIWITQRLVMLTCLPHSPILAPCAAVLLTAMALIIVTINMKNLTGIKTGSTVCFKWYAAQGWILAMVVAPLLIAAWTASAWLWSHSAQSWGSVRWALIGIVVFGLTWSLASLINLPETGPDAPHWSGPGAWWLSIFFSLISGAAGGLFLEVVTDSVIFHGGHPRDIWQMMTFGTPLIIFVFLFVGSLQIGLMGFYFPDPRREWWARLGGYLLVVNILWLAVFAVSIYSPLGLMWLTGRARTGLGVAWVTSTLIGVLGGKSAASGALNSKTWKDTALSVTPYVFIAGIAVFLAWALQVGLALLNSQCDSLHKFLEKSPAAMKVSGWIVSFDLVHGTGTVVATSPTISPTTYGQAYWQIIVNNLNYRLPIVFVGLLGVCLFLSWRFNINEFSMNLFYRNRLVRAYLGASHASRKPNPFTGFDPHDELQLKNLRADQEYSGPFPILNSALNLVKGKDLAWQERKAESFIFTPLRCGFDTWLEQMDLEDQNAPMKRSSEVQKYGFRPTEHFGFSDVGLRLGTAVAISGAAASPNMGYHSVPSLGVLMALFNVRLGFWAGNPRHDTAWVNPGPRIGLLYLLAELFGQTDDEAAYVYLSDGGHFENLGLYELVKRRCKFIIVCDAGCDGDYAFGDLGNAIRKCREDVGVEIELKTDSLTPLAPPSGLPSTTSLSHLHWSIGKIHYNKLDPGAPDGTLVYVKTSITGDEPADLRNYHREHPAYPHQSTGDQWFTESQFESYRRLGQHVIEKLFDPASSVFSDPGIKTHAEKTSKIFEKLREEWRVIDMKRSPGNP